MAQINKKLIHFKTKATFDKRLEANDIPDTSIAFIQDKNLIYTHGAYYNRSEVEITDGTPPVDPTKIWIDTSIDGEVIYIEDAPSDGKTYGRKDKQWVEVTADIYETAKVTITSNQTQPDQNLKNVNITVTYADQSETQKWEGSELTFKIPFNVDSYTISASSLDKYNCPTPTQTFTPVLGNTRNIALVYNTTKISITRNSDQASELPSSIVVVTYNSKSETLTFTNNKVEFNIPTGAAYTASFSKIANYTTPTQISETASGASKDFTITYKLITSVTEVAVFDDNNAAPAIPVSGPDTSWIVGKRCLVKNISNGVAICYLDENNSELFHDGTTAAKLDGTMGQWMTDIPEYWLSVDESETNKHKLSISNGEQVGYKHSRRVLLGVTEAVNVNNKLWSKKGGQSTGNLTAPVFHQYAIANGSGWDIIDYESHCKIAHLFYAKYANRDPQTMTQFGTGESSYTRTIGSTSSLGNKDGKTSTQISFLGIEDFYGGKYEWVGGIHQYQGTFYIYDGYEPDKIPSVPYRTYDPPVTVNGYTDKLLWGEYGDMIPTGQGGSSTTHYCDWNYVAAKSTASSRVVRRSYDSAGLSGGVAYFYASYDSGASSASVGSRVQFRGNIKVIKDPAEFIALPVI